MNFNEEMIEEINKKVETLKKKVALSEPKEGDKNGL